VSQVKKDILNGWKEIAAYVCRDRRTVERWEKQRGLPVRRVPGAGRATVYALISELDEWLASSRPDETEPADRGQDAAKAIPGPHQASQAQDQAQNEMRSPDRIQERRSAESFAGKAVQGDGPAEGTAGPGGAAVQQAIALPAARRWEWIAAGTLLVGTTLYFALALPHVRGHMKSNLEDSKPNTDLRSASSAMRARSQVAGVDDLYLEGIYSLEQRTPESLERAEQDFENAIAKDPKYAPAYAGLANTYILLREYYVMPDEEAFTKARTAAEHAVALDPQLSEAHASLGLIDFFWVWDTANAEREFRIALAEDPSSAQAHHWYGSMLTHEGRYPAAMEQLNLAQRLEPTSAAILSTRALALGLSGHRGEAIDLLEGLINESPGVSSPHAILAIVSRVEPADWTRYLDEMRRAAELRHSDEMLQVAAAAEPALHSGGERAMWAAILTTEEKLHPGSTNRTFLMAEAETGLGRDDAAFADLNQLAQRHDPNAMGVILDPTLAPLRRDRRFGQLLGALGLPGGER
jgi:tetratricopeptide (TPR) repeat protein